MRAPVVMALFAAASLLAAGAAWACSCVQWRSAADQLGETDLALVARADATLNEVGPGSEPGWRVTRFTVTETLKGPHRGVRHIAHAPGPEGGTCGVSFRRGEAVLVLAHMSRGRLITSSCMRPQFPIAAFERAARG